MNSVTRIFCAAGVSLGLAGFATGAAAQGMSHDTASYGGNMHNPGFYVGGGGGWGWSDDDDDLTLKGLAGWRFSPYVAVQGFYSDLGDHDFTATPGGEADLDTFGGELLLSYPLSQEVAIYGKGGIHRYNADFGAPGGNDDRDTSWLGGAGVEFAVARNMSVRTEWSHYDMDVGDVDDISAQLVFGF